MKYNVWESKLARFLTIDHGKYKEQFSYLISTFFLLILKIFSTKCQKQV